MDKQQLGNKALKHKGMMVYQPNLQAETQNAAMVSLLYKQYEHFAGSTNTKRKIKTAIPPETTDYSTYVFVPRLILTHKMRIISQCDKLK